MKHRFGMVGLAVLSGLAGGSLVGCGGPSPSERAHRDSRKAMAVLHSGVTPAPTETRRATQQKIVADLRGAADGLSGGEQVAALTLLSEAQAGLAQLDAEQATAAAARMGFGVRELRAAGGLYASQASLSAALGSFDVGADTRALEEQAKSIEGELASAMQEKRRREGELAGLETRAEGLLGRARALREEESQVRSEAAGMAASSRAPWLERARLISRQADALEKEAAETRAMGGQVGPLITVAGLEIERLSTQKSLLATAAKEIDARKTAREEQSASAARGADAAAAQLSGVLAGLERLRGEEFARSFESAAQGYRQAIGSAKRATGVGGVSEHRTTAQIAMAGLEQSLGALEVTRARALETYGLALAWIMELEPALAQRGEVEAALLSVREESSRAQASAGEAFESARRSLQSAGARGDLAERVDKLLALLPSARVPEPVSEPEPDPEMTPGDSENGAPGETGEAPSGA